MLSPNDRAPKSKAASIWSFDSGYGSTTLEDDEAPQVDYHGTSSTYHTYPQPTQQPIGLGLGGYCNIRVQDQLRVSRSVSPIGPVTTKLNVLTTQVGSSTDVFLPSASDILDTCVTCQLWNITNPGENLRCNDCRDKDVIVPQALHRHDKYPKAKLTVPPLDVLYEQQIEPPSRGICTTRCSACEISSFVDPTKPPGCSSCNPNPTLLSPISPIWSSNVKRSCARRAAKLPSQALRCLQAWLRNNRSNPYPDAETKRSLAQECGITEKQVNTWFTNARARRMNVSADRSNTPSEDEGNYESAFSSVTSTPICNSGLPFGYSTPSDRRCADPSNPTNGLNQAASTSSRRGKKKDYSWVNTVSPVDGPTLSIPPTPVTALATHARDEQQTWQCTFCYQHIAPKSWRRHEETQHRPKHKWTCLLTGPQLAPPFGSATSTTCAFCMAENPSEEHLLRSHRIIDCMKKTDDERTFLRPDHLRQHVKNFHKATLWEVVRDRWRRDGPGKNEEENWTCGFCGQELKAWDTRETHIAGHFKDGLTMADWAESGKSGPTIEPAKKRRNSNEEYSTMFTKLARTLTGRSAHQDEQPSSPSVRFANAWNPTPAHTGPSAPVAPLLPDTVFDTLMAEVYGNCVDSCDPTVTSGNELMPLSNNRYDSVVHDGEIMELDFDALADAFLNGSSMEFQGPWEQQRE